MGDVLTYCLAKPGAWQDEPWEGDVVVKVGARIFAFLGLRAPRWASSAVLPARPRTNGCCGTRTSSVMAYIGRSGWNTLRIGGAIPDDELIEAVDASYAAIVSKLPKKDRPA